ncbi:MAG: hypothetical protein JW779_02465 [Candidatus Thorarchaeota archaeon]|nr:hypothetical protein [Candidatus Thorarchaeota archaeon]
MKQQNTVLKLLLVCLFLSFLWSNIPSSIQFGISSHINNHEDDVNEFIGFDGALISAETEEIKISNPIWLRTYGPNWATNNIEDIIECADSGFCMLGTLGNPNDVGYFPDAILLKTDSNGNQLWNRTYGRDDMAYESVHNVIECSNGDFAFVGSQYVLGTDEFHSGWLVRVNSSGFLTYNITYPAARELVGISELSDGNFFICGITPGRDVFIMRTDENGTIKWSLPWELFLDDEVTDMIEYSPGEFIIAGYSYDSSMMVWIPFLFKIDQDSMFSWIKFYTLLGRVYCNSILKLDSGGILMTGMAVTSSIDLWFCEIDENGNFIREARLPNEINYPPNDIIQLEEGGFAVLTSSNSINLVNAQYEPIGNIRFDSITGNSFIQSENKEFVIGGSMRIENNYTLTIIREPFLWWNHSVINIQAEYLQSISRDFNATCSQGIDKWTVNATEFFDIDSNGVLGNNSILNVGTYPIKIIVNDTLENTLIQEFLVTVEDTTSPEWVQAPEDQILELGTDLNYSLYAFDPSGIGSWSINASGLFSISSEGKINNVKPLEIGTYGLMVTVEDIYGNDVNAEFTLTVTDSTAPIWLISPSNIIKNEDESIQFYFVASDLSGIDAWICNDTTNFQITDESSHDASSCLFTNATILNAGSYGLNLTVTDLWGNKISSIFRVTIIEIPEISVSTTTTSTSTTSQTSDEFLQPVVLLAAGSGWIATIFVIIIMMKRRT